MIRVTIIFTAAAVAGLSGVARADVIGADDFFYKQPTKTLGPGGGFLLQDYGGGENGAAGNWAGEWVSVGDAIIVGEDSTIPDSEPFTALQSDGTFSNGFMTRDYALNNLPDDQTLYFGGRIRAAAAGAVPTARIILSGANNADSEISVGLDEFSAFRVSLGDSDQFGSTFIDDDQFHQVIGKLEVNANGANERLTVWFDPTDVETGLSASVERDVITGVGDLDGVFQLELGDSTQSGGQPNAVWDDVAIGTDWSDVATVAVPRLTLQVGSSGSLTVANQTGQDFDLAYLEILHSDGALDPDAWNSLADQGTDGGAWMENAPSARRLVESNFAGATTLADGETLPLGPVLDAGADLANLTARWGTDLGLLNLMTIEQVAAGPGDFDSDGDVDGADFLALQRGFGNSTDAGDFAAWEANFGTGVAAGAAAAAVPEPTAVALLALAGILSVGRRRR